MKVDCDFGAEVGKRVYFVEMGLHVREIDVKVAEVALSIGASAPLLLDTDWLQMQYSKKLFVFNILCIGK